METLTKLLDKEADVDATDKDGKTALIGASYSKIFLWKTTNFRK